VSFESGSDAQIHAQLLPLLFKSWGASSEILPVVTGSLAVFKGQLTPRLTRFEEGFRRTTAIASLNAIHVIPPKDPGLVAELLEQVRDTFVALLIKGVTTDQIVAILADLLISVELMASSLLARIPSFTRRSCSSVGNGFRRKFTRCCFESWAI
jgi:hypothetical protein